MERLVTTAQAAELLGLSLQGIYYRIKKDQLKSIKKSGKIFVYIEDDDIVTEKKENKQTNQQYTSQDIVTLKNEQILMLKKSIKWMKKQYGSEISRLEKNQKDIIGVFNSEIKLLQSAFNEMRSIYKPMIDTPVINPSYTPKEKNDERKELITLKEFSIIMKRHHKTQNDIKLIILKAIKKNDNRFIYNRTDKKLLILNSVFDDLV